MDSFPSKMIKYVFYMKKIKTLNAERRYLIDIVTHSKAKENDRFAIIVNGYGWFEVEHSKSNYINIKFYSADSMTGAIIS